MTSPTKEKQAVPIHNKESRQRYLKFVNGGELDSCIATNIEEACELLGQKHYSRISDRSAICMANPGQSIESTLKPTHSIGRGMKDDETFIEANPKVLIPMPRIHDSTSVGLMAGPMGTKTRK